MAIRHTDLRNTTRRANWLGLFLGIVFLHASSHFFLPTFTSLSVRPKAHSQLTIPRQVSGYSNEALKESTLEKKRFLQCNIPDEQLQKDHGDEWWEDVKAVLNGKRAKSAENMMRARLSAVRDQDARFLGLTEDDWLEGDTAKKRAQEWKRAFGQAEIPWLDQMFWNKNFDSLKQVDSFSIISAGKDFVEFKIKCKDGKTLHEKSGYKEHPKFGYVFTGRSDFQSWE